MVKKSSILILTLALMFMLSNAFAQKPTYVGTKKCRACHMKDGTYKVWEKTKHATAFKTLQSEDAKKINKGKAANAEKSCLGCHVLESDKENGVGCEVCHGPGSAYAKMDVMKDKTKSKTAGLLMAKDDSKVCEKCHNKKSPTYKDFKYKVEWPKVAHAAKKS